MANPPTIMSNLMAFGTVIIQSCMLGFPESMERTVRDAIEGGRWIEAWERLLKTVKNSYLVSDCSPLKPTRDDAEPTSNVDPSTNMPGSHNIIKELTTVSPRLNTCGDQLRNTSTPLDAGCGTASSSNSSHKHQVAVSLPSLESSTTLQPHSCPNDMIGAPAVHASDCVPEQPSVGSRLVCEEDSESVSFLPPACSCLVCEEDRENDILLELRLDGRNIVLDSLYPHIAPHIVITPPVTYADDFYTPNNNRVDLQWPCFLNVPRLTPHIFYHHCPLLSPHDESVDCDPKRFESQTVASADESGGVRPGAPLRVFNRQQLLTTVETSSTERLIFREVVDGLFRHRRKAAAFEASLSAPAACTRFNESGAASHLERPFVWTDPAQPILAARYFSGISIIESDSPFRAPHIMITAAPPHDPWISWRNRVEDQDYDYLPVYIKRDSSPPPNNLALDSTSTPGPQLHHENPDTFSIQSHSNHSRELLLIDTPTSSLDDSGCFLMDTPHETCELGCAHCSNPDHLCHFPDVNASLDIMSAGRSCKTPTPDFDDEEDLPPFDDWYLSVIERSKVVGS